MDGVEAIGSLQQNGILVLANRHVAEVTQLLVLHSFDLLHDTNLLLHRGRIVHSIHIPACLLVFVQIVRVSMHGWVRLFNGQG